MGSYPFIFSMAKARRPPKALASVAPAYRTPILLASDAFGYHADR